MPHRCFLSDDLPPALNNVVRAFAHEAARLRSQEVRQVPQVLEIVEPHLRPQGWVLAQGARQKHGLSIAAVAGPPINADGVHRQERAALWVETGRSWTNNGYLEHLVRPSACPTVDHVAIALREIYTGPAYAKSVNAIDQLLSSGRLGLPYHSVVIIGF